MQDREVYSVRVSDMHSVPHTCQTGFRPHPNLSDAVNRQIVQSEIEGGVSIKELAPETILLVLTQHSCYRVVLQEEGRAWISGHPRYCPEPVLVNIEGCTWGGSMLKPHFIGRGMHLEFRHPAYTTPIVTSRIEEIQSVHESRRSASNGPN